MTTTAPSPICANKMKFDVAEAKQSVGGDYWIVEAIDYASEGEIYAASFSGQKARERAIEYAAWKNVGGGISL